MSDSESEEINLYSSEHGWVRVNSIQQVVSAFDGPGLIFLPESTWEESLIITQHNLTIIGQGENTIIESQREQPPITIAAPSVRLLNFRVKSKHEISAISLSHDNATQVVLQSLNISESGKHGIVRDENYSFDIIAILNCRLKNIAGDGIVAPTGTGPNNLLLGNVGEDIGGDFIRWGVNKSILSDNRCDDAPINITENAHGNLVFPHSGTDMVPGWPDDNSVIE